jgi:RND family efflux transporter, MFP subunit
METEHVKQTVPNRRPGGAAKWIVVLVSALVVALIVGGGIWQRSRAEEALVKATEDAAISTVDVIHPQLDESGNELVLPGNAQAFIDTPIFARTGGYLRAWNFDIGSHVKKGQLLAEIEAPELDKQLLQARANLATAQSNHDIAAVIANRNERLLKTNSISTQETENAQAQASATKTITEASAAELARLEQMKAYQRIYAPFDGVITARNTDVGAVIESGVGGAKELFHISKIDKLRVFVPVPEMWSRYTRPGTKAELTLTEFPNRAFACVLVRTSNAIETSTRTLLTEFDVDNPTGELLPGSYVQVHLKLPSRASALTVPANTLLFRSEGLRVGVVKDGKTVLTPITIGRDFGTKVEVLSGVQQADDVILDPSDSLIDGLAVRVRAAQGHKKK